jgi:hypothetical protein
MLLNPKNANADADLDSTEVAAQRSGCKSLFSASTEDEIDAAFKNLVQQRAATLFLAADHLFRPPLYFCDVGDALFDSNLQFKPCGCSGLSLDEIIRRPCGIISSSRHLHRSHPHRAQQN